MSSMRLSRLLKREDDSAYGHHTLPSPHRRA